MLHPEKHERKKKEKRCIVQEYDCLRQLPVVFQSLFSESTAKVNCKVPFLQGMSSAHSCTSQHSYTGGYMSLSSYYAYSSAYVKLVLWSRTTPHRVPRPLSLGDSATSYTRYRGLGHDAMHVQGQINFPHGSLPFRKNFWYP